MSTSTSSTFGNLLAFLPQYLNNPERILTGFNAYFNTALIQYAVKY